MFAVNSKAAFFVMREAARRMEDGGKIITIVTWLLAAYTGLCSSYAGSKAPVEHFTRALSKELFGRNIMLTDGWWANGQTLFLNGGHTTR